MIDTVYIMSAGHSGSTLLNLLLGAHSRASAVSELTHLPKNIAHNEMCSCGRAILECPIWSQVIRRLGKRLGLDLLSDPYGLQLGFIGDNRAIYSDRLGRSYQTIWKIRRILVYLQQLTGIRLPAWAQHEFAEAQEARVQVYEEIRAVTGEPVVVDASKEYLQGVSLYQSDPARTRLILLVRDGRAVFYSNLRRSQSWEESLQAWRKYYRHALPIIDRRIPAEHIYRVRYEDLVADTEQQLRQICHFLGLEFESAMLNPQANLQHVTSGNNMRLSARKTIKLDTTWMTALSGEQVAYFDRHAGDLNRKLGYV
jgi:Sulfotransferase family